MKGILLLLLLAGSNLFAQTNFLNQPYIETSATADTLIMPNRINMSVILSEGDSRGKKSVEELEQVMKTALTQVGIDVLKELTLVTLGSDYERYFLGGLKVNKTKLYQLTVHDAVTASKVITALEQVDISNVSINSKQYSKQEELLTELKVKAVKKAKENAQALARAAGKDIGDVLFISDIITPANDNQNNKPVVIRGVASIGSGIYGNRAPNPLPVDFQKLQYQVHVSVIFSLK